MKEAPMPYLKAFLAIVASAAGALVTAVGTGATDFGDIDTQTWLVAAGTVLGSGGIVWLVQNVPGVAGGAIKAAVAFLSAGIASLVVALDDRLITQTEWLTAFSTAVVATGAVYQAKNT
jgi:hypothetical protein